MLLQDFFLGGGGALAFLLFPPFLFSCNYTYLGHSLRQSLQGKSKNIRERQMTL